MDTPVSYAKSIAYLRCPEKVRWHTKAAFGVAPSLEVCTRLVDAHTAHERRFKAQAERRQIAA